MFLHEQMQEKCPCLENKHDDRPIKTFNFSSKKGIPDHT